MQHARLGKKLIKLRLHHLCYKNNITAYLQIAASHCQYRQEKKMPKHEEMENNDATLLAAQQQR